MKQSRLQTSYLYFVYLAMSVLVICSLLARFRIINDTLCSLSDLILPLVYLIVFIVLIISYFLSLYRDIFWKNLFIFVGTPLLLWPPLWLLRTTPPSRVETQVVRISTWNVARMGELAMNDQKQQKKASLNCVRTTLNQTHSDLFALQEISKRRVRDLEKQMKIRCKHVDYYGVGGGDVGGLAICARIDSQWHINFARNFQLEGRWRALFAEIENHGVRDKIRFNLLNVHFLPHYINTSTIKNVVNDLAQGSLHQALNLLRQMIETTRKQAQQAESLMKVVQTFVDPTILVGDFNSPAHSKVHWVLGQEWTDTWKQSGIDFGATRYFAGWLPFRVDFIYAHKHAFEALSSFVQNSQCSDHEPLSTDLRFIMKDTP